ncbi:EAL domain-containing protein [Alcanivorax sp. 1008]|uniref:sensor domain-containing phosphodiesterase n=1 Tax=Alcanivorax sp. 1008 TaxID=2816853 RepID=UPI001DFF5003|nr:EAL domain-containing protein [Alcanivorax sp. 1008]MCC1497319.1 EAL domain-containing protein [Alcanivorax sp. 1008]
MTALRKPPSGLTTTLLVGLALFLAAELSRLLSVDVSEMSAIWPPLGIAIGAVLVLGFRAVLLYAVVLAVWLVWRGHDSQVVVLILLEQSLQSALAGALLRSRLSNRPLLSSLPDTLRFYFWGALLALLPTSLMTTAALYQQGMFADFRLIDVWLVYWLSEALGVMLFAPLAEQAIRSLVGGFRLSLPKLRTVIFFVLLGLLIVLSAQALLYGQPDYGKALTYLYFPMLAWAAMSGQRWLALVAVPLVASIVLGYVVISIRMLGLPAGFLLVEAVLVIFMMTLMSQLVQSVSQDRAALSRSFREQARRDLRTGLLNDRGLLERVRIGRKKFSGHRQFLVVLEIGNFAEAQDLLDLDFVRALERYVGAKVTELMGPVAVARLSAGVFGIFWHGPDDSQGEARLDEVWQSLQGFAFSRDGSVYVLSVSIGVIELSPGDALESALSAAGQAARHAAQLTDRPFFRCRMNDDMVVGRQQKLAMLEEVKGALSENRFLLYGQEIRSVQSVPEKPYFEILLRMLDRDNKLVSPAVFLPVAQDYGLMGQLDRWVVERAFAWLHQRPDEAGKLGKVAINLSGDVLADPDFPTWVISLMDRYPLPAGLVGFEVTESQQITDWPAACELLGRLRDLGFAISLDDFGTGLATFDYLTSFPFDVLKIDGRFIRNIEHDSVDQAIVSSITQVARTMGLKTVAEYVEHPGIASAVTALGVDYLQGYGVGKPLSLEEIGRHLLEASPAVTNTE